MIVQSENQSSESEQSEIHLDVAGIVKRRYPLIMLGILIGTFIATLVYLIQSPIYESEIVVLVGQRTSELTSTGKANVEGETRMQEEILSTHMELFSSQKMISQAIVDSDLATLTTFTRQYSNEEALSPLKRILKNLKVTKGGTGLAKNASVLKATYRDGDPDNAAKILSGIYESYKKYIDSQSRNVGAEAAKLIEEAQVKNEKELQSADKDYREFVQSVPAFVNSRSNGEDELHDVHRLRLSKIETELSTLRTSLAELSARYDVIKENVSGKKIAEITDAEVMALLSEKEVKRILGLLEVLNDNHESTSDKVNVFKQSENAKTEYGRLSELISKQRVMNLSLGENHPTVLANRQEIAAITEYLEKEREKIPEDKTTNRAKPSEMLVGYINVIQTEIAELRKREITLLELSNAEAKEAKEVEMSFLLGNSLKMNRERAQNRYDEVFKRLQEIRLTNEYAGFSTDLIASPAPGDKPVWPKKSIVGGVGILAGIALGFGLALLADFADRTFRSPEDVESSARANILVHIPKMNVEKLKKKVGSSKIAPTISAFHDPRGSDSETFRVLRTVILFQAKKAEQNVFMVTSPSPGDGKSTTIANLAVSLAQTGKRILLIDADMRRPTITKSFGLDDVVGLSDILEGQATLEECCIASEQSNLDICTEGSVTSHPSELLESERFVKLVEQVREKYDIVLIDTPPLLAVADPAIISTIVDGCFLTMRIEKNNRTLVERSCEILRDHDAKLLGVIVNSRKAGRQSYGYTQYNYYGDKEYGYQANYRRYYAAKDSDKESVPRTKPSRNGHTDAKNVEARG